MIYLPYPRRLESLTIKFADVITIRQHRSPQLFKGPQCWSGRHLNPRASAQLSDAQPTEPTDCRQRKTSLIFEMYLL